MVTKHTKPSMSNQQGGIVHQEAPIDASNVMLIHDGKPTRVGFKMDGDKKVRFAKSTPMLTTILSSFGISIAFLYPNFLIIASLISFSYCSLSLLNGNYENQKRRPC